MNATPRIAPSIYESTVHIWLFCSVGHRPARRSLCSHCTRQGTQFCHGANPKYNTHMATLDDLARKLGISKRAVRFRVDALSDLLERYTSRDERNRLIFTGEAVFLLHRLEELRLEEQLPIRQAAVRLRGELQHQEGDTTLDDTLGLEIKLEYLARAVETLRHDRDYWRSVAETIQTVLPPDRMWISKLFPPTSDDIRLN